MLGDNQGVFDGLISKDLKENTTKNDELQVFFHVAQKYQKNPETGRWVKRRNPVFAAFCAYGDLAREILDRFTKGQFVRVEYRLDSFRRGRWTQMICHATAIRPYSQPQADDPRPEDWMVSIGQGFEGHWTGKPGKFAFH